MAIAFDGNATDGNGATATSHSFNHTTGTGSNRLLVVQVVGDYTTDDITSVTYNSVAMTLVNKVRNAGLARWVYLYYLLNPASGTNSVAITAGSSHFLYGQAASYTGVAQSGQPDANNTATSNTSPVTASVTTVAANCWAIFAVVCETATIAPSTGSTTRVINANVVAGTMGLFDSNTDLSPGANSMSVTTSGGSPWFSSVIASFAPAIGGASTTDGKIIFSKA